MVSNIKRALVEIRHGENLDIYLTILPAIIISVLGIFQLTRSEIVSAVTVGVLALLSYSLMTNRRAATQLGEVALQVSAEVRSVASKLSIDFDSLQREVHTHLRNKTYEEQADMYTDLERYIDQYGAREAVLIQHGGRLAASLLRKLASKGAAITLFVQSPEAAVSQMEKNRILSTAMELEQELRVTAPFVLTVYEYEVPASVRAVMIDNDTLAIGWYTYEHKLIPDQNFPQDLLEVSGHDIPGRLLHKGTQGYAVLSKMVESLASNYKEHYKVAGKQPRIISGLRPIVTSHVPTN